MRNVPGTRNRGAAFVILSAFFLMLAVPGMTPSFAQSEPAMPVTIGTCWPPDELILLAADSDMDQEFYAELRDGTWQDGSAMGGTLYWSVQFGSETETLVRDEDEELHTGTFLHLYGLAGGTVRALAVPEYVPADESAILEYALSQPLGVHAWTVQVVPAQIKPAIEALPGSGLYTQELNGELFIRGLSVLTAPQNTPGNIAACFVYFEGTNPLFLCDGRAMDPSGTIGTGTVYELAAYGPRATFSVQGDVTGDGRASISDLVRMAQALTGTLPLSDAAMLAVTSGTGPLTLTDLVKEAVLVTEALPADALLLAY